MSETTKKSIKKALTSAAFFAAYALAFAFIWWIAASAIANEWVFPHLSSVLKEMGKTLAQAFFWTSLKNTLLRVLWAFSISFLAALVFAIIAYLVPMFGRIFAPIVSMLRALPILAIMLFLVLWSTPAKAPVIVAYLSLFPSLYTGIGAALATVDKTLIDMSKVYRVPIWKRITKMYLPIAFPYVLRECSGAISFALKLVVSAEVIANTYISLGMMIQTSISYTEVAQMFALTLITLFVGLILELIGACVAALAERRMK